MNETINVMTGTVRIFDGYDRWEKFSICEYGTEKELLLKKTQYEHPLHQPIFPSRKYQDLVIRKATTQEITQYHNQLLADMKKEQQEYSELSKKANQIASSIATKQKKLDALDKLKIPY